MSETATIERRPQPAQPKAKAPKLRIGDTIYYWDYTPGSSDVPVPAIVMFVHEDGALNLTTVHNGYHGYQAHCVQADPAASPRERMGKWSPRE